MDPERTRRTIVWLDGLVTNPDRTAQNPNLLVWHGRTWLIDHGAALYIHHTWRDPDAHARRRSSGSPTTSCCRSPGPWPSRRRAWRAGSTRPWSRASWPRIPDAWLPAGPAWPATPTRQRRAYVRYLTRRLESPRPFVEDAERARAAA